MQSGHLDATPYVIDPNKILWTVHDGSKGYVEGCASSVQVCCSICAEIAHLFVGSGGMRSGAEDHRRLTVSQERTDGSPLAGSK